MICQIYNELLVFLLYMRISVSSVIVSDFVNFRTASGTFHDGNLLLNQKGMRLITEEKESQVSFFYFKHTNLNP